MEPPLLTGTILVHWLFNGKSTQKDQCMPNAGKGNWLSRLRMAIEIQVRYTKWYTTTINIVHNYILHGSCADLAQSNVETDLGITMDTRLDFSEYID